MVVPNSMLVRNPFLVLGQRTGRPRLWRRWVCFNVDFRFTPGEVIHAVTEAVRAAPIELVAADPAPNCVLMDLHESYGRYAVRYWLMDLAVDDPTDSAVRTRIYFALRRAAIPLSIPAHAIFMTEESRERKVEKSEEEMERRSTALAHVDLFDHLSDGERQRLGASLRYAPFSKGEVMTRQGAEAHWLYMITDGEASVQVSVGDEMQKEVARLRAGNFFGEMSLMTGASRSATVVAATDVECYRLDKAAFQEIIREHPELAEKVAEILARRRVQLEAARENLDAEALRRRLALAEHDLLGRMRHFFGLAPPHGGRHIRDMSSPLEEDAMLQYTRPMPRVAEDARENALDEGRALRQAVPRRQHATWSSSMRRVDPLEALLATNRHRLPRLLPLRFGRMSQSPFTYLRGAAASMAADVARTPLTGLQVQACGDCHLGNFGAFASPERRVLFDINDFDETYPAGWEYDVKRLAVSFVLLARTHGYGKATAKEVTRTVLRSYRSHLHALAGLSPLDRWYALIDSEILIRTAPDEATRRRRIKFERRARARTGESLVGGLVERKDGGVQFRSQPPVITRLERGSKLEVSFRTALERYPSSMAEDRRFLLSRYRLIDIAFKVVGVGSVGTRCAVALYEAEAGNHLVLQVKEACPSVLAPYAGKSAFEHEGQRVVVGQRLMQCASDIFLGWASDDDGHDYYVRQLRDMKTSVPVEALRDQVLFNFAEMCGWALARAHAKAGDALRLAGYVGTSERLDDAVTSFANEYANQCERDYEVFMRAIRAGKIATETEPRTS